MVKTTCRRRPSLRITLGRAFTKESYRQPNSATSGALVAGETAVGNSICILPRECCAGTPGRPASDLAWRPANGDATVFEPEAGCAGFSDSLAAFVSGFVGKAIHGLTRGALYSQYCSLNGSNDRMWTVGGSRGRLVLQMATSGPHGPSTPWFGRFSSQLT